MKTLEITKRCSFTRHITVILFKFLFNFITLF